MPEVVKEVKKIAGASDTGGFLGAVFSGASKRFGEAEVALPAAMAGAYGLPGGLRGVQKAWTAGGDRTPISLARAFRSGWKDESTGKTYGGFGGPSGWGSKGWRQGSSIRKTIDRIRENRLFEAEDIEKTLSRLAQGKTGGEKDAKSTSLPAGEPAPSSGKH